MIKKDSFLYRVIAAPGLKLIAAAEWLISRNSANNTFFDTNSFPWTKALENRYPEIRSELDFLLENKPIPDFSKLSEEQQRIVPENGRLSFSASAANTLKKTAVFVRSLHPQLERFPELKAPGFPFWNRARILAGIAAPTKGF